MLPKLSYWKCLFVTILLSLLICRGTAFAAWQLQAKITAPTPDSMDRFGYAVDISNTNAIIGASDNGGRGVVYIYERGTDPCDPNWILQNQITHSSGYGFGEAVAIDGEWAIVGAPDHPSGGTIRGQAYMIHWDGGNWVQYQTLTASDKSDTDMFGYSVSVNGDYAIVGAYGGDKTGGPSNCGTAYVFYWDGLSWNEQIELASADAAADDHFGNSVSINGDYAVIGAYFDDDSGAQSGSAYIFYHDGNEPNQWSQQKKIKASDGSSGAAFGWSVSLDGDYAIVGASGQDSGGAAYVFRHDGSEPDDWSQQQKLTPTGSSENFGCSVSIDGRAAMVGDNYDSTVDTWAGAAYIFRRDGTVWSRQIKLTALDGESGDFFGWAVAINSNDAFAAAPYHDHNSIGSDHGAVYAYKQPSSIILLDPLGGEQLRAGSNCWHSILWETIGNIGDVSIEYSFDGGLRWNIVDTVYNNDSYEWKMPYKDSEQYLVRVSDAYDSSVYDTSGDVFSITVCPLVGDLTCDCCVNFDDVAVMFEDWLECE